jgi:hypothetical protein
MLSSRPTGWMLLVFGGLLLAACGDDPTAPEVLAPNFPALDAAFATEFCIRGTLAPNNSVSGEISDTDCETVAPVGSGPGSFYEGWRVRVAQAGSVTIQTASGFDTFVDLFRIDDLSAPTLDDLIIFDDDSGAGENGRVTVTLQPGTEYWVMVSGFDADEAGPYTLEARN